MRIIVMEERYQDQLHQVHALPVTCLFTLSGSNCYTVVWFLPFFPPFPGCVIDTDREFLTSFCSYFLEKVHFSFARTYYLLFKKLVYSVSFVSCLFLFMENRFVIEPRFSILIFVLVHFF